MANQSPDRREALEMIAMASFASAFPGFSRWVCAPQHAVEESVHPRPAAYQPRFFSASEFALIDRLTERIIPADTAPGAHDAGVAEFIDFMASADSAIQAPFRDSLVWFATQPPKSEADTLLSASAPGSPGYSFFKLLRKYTVMGYYTSRIGLEALDYPGLKFYSASPECPHHGDPEHVHLPPPRV
jgi:hypothetical protein